MPNRVTDGQYAVGQIKQKRGGPRPRRTGTFGVIRGDAAMQNGHLEWKSFCDGSLKASKWYIYRIGPGDSGHGTDTDFLSVEDTKKEAVEKLVRKKGSKFDEQY